MLCTVGYDQGFLVDSIDRHLTLLTAYFTGYVPGSVTEFCEVQLIIPNHCHNQGKFMGELLLDLLCELRHAPVCVEYAMDKFVCGTL